MYISETDPLFMKSPASLVTTEDIVFLRTLPQELKEVQKQEGPPGKTPKRGIDYLTAKDIAALVKMATPVKGKHYFDGKNGRTPIKGIDYFDGEPGKDGDVSVLLPYIKKGIDAHKKEYDHSLIKKIPEILEQLKPKAKSAADTDELRQIVGRMIPPLPQQLDRGAVPEFNSTKLNALTADRVVVTDENKKLITIAVTATELAFLSGVSSNIQDQINALGGGSTAVHNETPAGAINDVNTTYTLAHTPNAGTLHLLKNGVEIYEGEDFTLTGLTITLSTALAAAFESNPADKLRATYNY